MQNVFNENTIMHNYGNSEQQYVKLGVLQTLRDRNSSPTLAVLVFCLRWNLG